MLTLLRREPRPAPPPADDGPGVAGARARLAEAEAGLAAASADSDRADQLRRAALAEQEARGAERAAYVAAHPPGGRSHDHDESARLRESHKASQLARHDADGRCRAAADRRDRASAEVGRARAALEASIADAGARATRDREEHVLPVPEAARGLADALEALAGFEAGRRPRREAAVRAVVEARQAAQRLFRGHSASPSERAAAARAEREAVAAADLIPAGPPARLAADVARARVELAKAMHAAGVAACRVGDTVIIDKTTVEPGGTFESFDPVGEKFRPRTVEPVVSFILEIHAGLVDLAAPEPGPAPEIPS